jgi:hypothetical protein
MGGRWVYSVPSAPLAFKSTSNEACSIRHAASVAAMR